MGLELAFQSQQLRTLCESMSAARRAIGERPAATLKRRIADLRAAESVAEVLESGLQAFAEGETLGNFSVLIDETHRLVISSGHRILPMKSGTVDWTQVYRIKILRIEITNA